MQTCAPSWPSPALVDNRPWNPCRRCRCRKYSATKQPNSLTRSGRAPSRPPSQADLTRPRQPLEQFPLDGLRMVGTLNKGGQTYALIRTPENTLYRIRKGEYMGQNFGLVVAINDMGIELRETVQDGAGDWTETKATLALQE